jgi:branched-chain amino acid transport system ATP-binding protein
VVLLEARDVTVRFGGKAALSQTSIDVERGMITGLIGPNGAGKTTLFNVVCGLLTPQGGHVVLDGSDVTRAPPHRRARLGLARTFQRLELFTSLTVRDNIRVGGDIRNHWSRRRADSTDEAERIIELTGLGPIADREVSEIPTGRARVVELARALMTRPSVLLLDEPAAGLDLAGREALVRTLSELALDPGAPASVLVTHHVEEIPVGMTHALLLRHGRVVAAGELQETLTADHLSATFELPLSLEQSDGRWVARAI